MLKIIISQFSSTSLVDAPRHTPRKVKLAAGVGDFAIPLKPTVHNLNLMDKGIFGLWNLAPSHVEEVPLIFPLPPLKKDAFKI